MAALVSFMQFFFNFSYKNRSDNQDLETKDCTGDLITG